MKKQVLFCAALFTTALSAWAQYMQPSRPAPSPLPAPAAEGTLTGRLGSSTLPADKRYSELTRDQKEAFKAQYQSMTDDDEPPFPVDGLGSLYKPIAEAQRSMRLEGALELEAEIDSTGKARSVSVRKSPSAEITQVAAAALLFQTYKPAVCRGKPCAMVFPLQVDLIRR